MGSGDVAHLGYVELRTPKLEQSTRFFVDVLGMSENGRSGDSVYLRCWDEYQHHTLKLTGHATSGVGRVGIRMSSADALVERAAALERAGHRGVWVDADVGRGSAYQFADPDGHGMELYWEAAWYEAKEHERPALKNQAQRFPARGANVRRLDHLNYFAVDAEANASFVERLLGGRRTEQIVLDDGTRSAVWLTFTNKTYDLVYTRDESMTPGRLHHVTFAVDSREDVLKAADICLDGGVPIETGPHKHAIQQTFFLYVFEPGGNRVELCNAGARLMLAPDWKVINWTQAERAKGQAWGLKTIESFHTYGTPPV